MKITAGNAEQYHDTETGESRIRVPWAVTDDEGAEVYAGVQSFSADTTEEEVKDFLSRTLAVYKDDVARAAEAAPRQEAIDKATALAGEITGMEVTD